ncbi:MAG: hypothetical protein KC619_32355 [Myxococcales bacterium]|nr:hypothetical protein [Myxococcales bacterium]
MSDKPSNMIFVVIGVIMLVMLGAGGAMLWISISNDAARGYIPRDQRAVELDGGP